MHKADKQHLGKGLKAQGTRPYEEVYPGLKRGLRESTVGQDKLIVSDNVNGNVTRLSQESG